MLLGGSAQQIIAIETAKKMGYYTVLCDYLTDNPGQYIADKFYLESTTERETILKIAEKEQIDGILAYASDPAAPTAAYVAEKLVLPTNPYKSVDILCNKDKFREFLKENDFDCPESKGYNDSESAISDIKNGLFEFPIIIKPVDSSGSKGVTVLYDDKNLLEAIEFAFTFSHDKRIIIEEFIEMKHEYTIGGDIFIHDGKIVIWGLMNCFRAHSLNFLVPGGEIYPILLNEQDVDNIKAVLQRLVTSLDISNGCMNIEIMIDKNDRIYLIDVGPRAGGNMIPIQLGYIFGVDIVEMSVKCAMGENFEDHSEVKIPYCSTYVLHSDKSGVYKSIEFSEKIEKYIFKKVLYKEEGDDVETFDNASKALGIIFLKFSGMEEMLDKMNRMNEFVKVVLK